MHVDEVFFSVEVDDMQRAVAFYEALGARVSFSTPAWTSVYLAGVRLGLFCNPRHAEGRIGLHLVVRGLDAAFAEIERAGGGLVTAAREVAPGVVVAEVHDGERNTFTLREA